MRKEILFGIKLLLCKMNVLSSKNGQATSTVIGFVLGAIVLVMAIMLLSGAFDRTQAATNIECGQILDLGQGKCKPTCAQGETRVKGYGCKDNDDGTPIYCCIDPNYKSSDYGGDYDYHFDVFDIGLDDSKCVPKANAKDTYTCSGTDVKVKMTVTNTGKYELNIFANPSVDDKYPKQGTAQLIKPGETKNLDVPLTGLSKTTHIIKAAAKCNTGVCKEKFGDEGIFKQKDNQFITVIVS